MIRSAVTRLSPLLLLAVVSCVQQIVEDPIAEVTERSSLKNSTPVEPKPATPQGGRVTRIMLGDLFQLQQTGGALIFDVRPGFIYQLGHIPGAISWPKNSFQSQLSAHETEIVAARAAKKPVVVYCVDLACPDARTVAGLLAERGHSIAVLEGGYDAWKTGDLPTE
jgi:rhodanese-related sulfurtransferase